MIGCLAANDSYGLLEFESGLSVAKAMDGISLQKLSREIEKKNVVKAISYLVLRLSENFNVGKKFSSEQASILAMDLFEVFGYETLEDVVLMFRYARQGKIGDGKDFKLDSQTVFHKWVPEYLELKAIERENQHKKTLGEKTGMANFRWKAEDVEKLEVSEKVETIRQGIGERMKKQLNTPPQYKSPVQDRKIYLNLLKETASKASTKELISGIKNLKESGKEPDALAVMEAELNSRK